MRVSPRSILILAGFFALALPLASSAEPTSSARDPSVQAVYEEALRLKSEGRLDEAERHFTRVLELVPSHGDARFELANLYAERYDRLGIRRALEGRELLERSAGELEQVVMMRPDFLAARYNLGVIDKRLGRFEEAREEFREVLRLDPRSVQAQMQLGATYEEQGFFDEAKDAYRRAQEMDFTNPDIRTALEDLDEHEAEARRRMLAQTAPGRLGSFREGFRYSPDSHARQYEALRQGEATMNQSFQQVLPYVGALLVEQLMKIRSKQGGGEEGTQQ